MTGGLWCECHITLRWEGVTPSAENLRNLHHEATLLLNAINQMESSNELTASLANNESGSAEQARMARMEAKLDLTLYLLARVLHPPTPAQAHPTRFSPQQIQWQDDAPPPPGRDIVLEFQPSQALPLALRLPAVVETVQDGMVNAVLPALPEALADAWHQFVFRRHRQGIREKTQPRRA